MIRAKLETRHFTFDAYGETEEEALAVLKNAWDDTHRRHYPSAAPFDEAVEDGDVCFYPIELFACYRDGEKISEENP